MAASALHRPLLFFHRPRVCPLSCHVQLRGPDFTCISTAFYVGYYPWGPCSTLHWLWGIAQTSLKLGEFIQTSHLCNIIISGWEGVAALLGNDKLYDSKFNHEFRQAVCFLLSVTPRVSEFVSIVWPCFLWMSDLGHCHASSEVWLWLWEHRGGGICWARAHFLEELTVTAEGRRGCWWRLFQVKHALEGTLSYRRGWQILSVKGPVVNIRPEDFVTTTQLCSFSMKASTGDM